MIVFCYLFVLFVVMKKSLKVELIHLIWHGVRILLHDFTTLSVSCCIVSKKLSFHEISPMFIIIIIIIIIIITVKMLTEIYHFVTECLTFDIPTLYIQYVTCIKKKIHSSVLVIVISCFNRLIKYKEIIVLNKNKSSLYLIYVIFNVKIKDEIVKST
ncbi:hypothetical protein KUTeg_005279 [Tegillarca granosa]|uniref:Uncharacterized protein n=1 Tax=Tegillarca granosa TaxID=220873 RepID=A0ABQ9FJB7_TEGGR|nr:hypothetical protein KUTeg_005279 [Tegillarca granosa]